MLLCGDESGSINNHDQRQPYFVVTLINVLSKGALKGKYKQFVKENYEKLKELDANNEMFDGERILELKGHCFDTGLKHEFLRLFMNLGCYELFYIKYNNARLTDNLCRNKERAFNYPFKKALSFFIKHGLLPNEDCHINLDTRNIRTDTKMSLAEYLNTDLIGNIGFKGTVELEYYDSKRNRFIQLADVFSNIYYTNLFTGEFNEEINQLLQNGRLKKIFEFPL